MNSQRITLVAVLFMGYFTSGILSFAFPFFDVPISIIWNGIMLEYLGYSVFLYYGIWLIPCVVQTYFGMQKFVENFANLINFLAPNLHVPNHPIIIPMVYLGAFLDNIFYALIIHKTLKKMRLFRSFIP